MHLNCSALAIALTEDIAIAVSKHDLPTKCSVTAIYRGSLLSGKFNLTTALKTCEKMT